MEFGFAMMWVLIFSFLFYGKDYEALAILFVLAILSGAIPVSLSWF